MVVSQASECAIRAMVYMTGFSEDEVVSKRDICSTQKITPAFLIKIMQPLIAEGLVKSYRGKSGGSSLGKHAEEISMWDIVSAIEGPITLNKCLIHEGYCVRDSTCPVHRIWEKGKHDLEETLKKATLAELHKLGNILG